MVGEQAEVSTPLLENILNQADALRRVSDYQFGEGSEALERAGAMLRSRKRIVLSGMGASYFACIPLQHMLAHQKSFDVTCVETAELLHFKPASLAEDTAVVLVSRSGESIEVIKMLDILLDSGTPVLGVVNEPTSSLARGANQSIALGCPPDQLVAIQTYTATLAVFALLAAAVSHELSRAKAELAKTIEVLARTVPEWVRERKQLGTFLEGDAPLYLLGRGRALGAVLEGMLLMHEIAKATAVGMSIPQFRHGPVEVVDSRFRALVIGTQRSTENLDSNFANDLLSMGGQIRWLGPGVSGAVSQPLCAWPSDVPESFIPILETVPLQIAAYTKAELHGIRPGDFRWAPAITNSETGFLKPERR
jgi:glucosamine--fructose-6-phosphate aminotransferase (isomerizing)